MKNPKFKIGDIVCFEDSFSANPAEDAMLIARIEGIHLKRKSFIGSIPGWYYWLSAGSTIRSEKELKKWNPK